ncbi:MAG: hypothetical protein A3D31_09175 [Candidatus Fluviicola riflensis]|nr:MAG: hypothetical protein CHH17_13585 [Candidatus Fluviicola riflensis]OGS77178.1 MAG: hypothetical protein A3D31_09175 [Candidatus Fluviicola riflensis]OGS82113.1 MAG: hypothetical protein A2724_18120 [Fluviicola sp. RIFCSPHIGHO2_01_FULL_43_53]OGS87807.1 MAG: hypothetical protein A3E30_15555 [Fluviicola sp. RIFCSPHIGHO2_12_FULL_43_24]
MATQKQKKSSANPISKPTAAVSIPQLSEAVLDKRIYWVLCAIAFLLFSNTLTHGFVLDDLAVIEQNKFVQEGFSGIPKIMTTFYWEGYWDSNGGLYRPLSMVMFAAEWGISPNNPFFHHFFNVLLYALSIGALYKLLRLIFNQYTLWIPCCIAVLFAVHPIHTEVVANIKSRDEILCFLFFVLTFRVVIRSELRSWKHRLIAAGLFLLCLLSKEAGILFLPVMGLYFLLFKQQKVLQIARTFLPIVLISIAWLAFHQWIIQSSVHERITYTYLDNSLVGCPDKASQVATGIAILGRYLLKSFVPANMSYDYSYNQIPCESFGSPIVLATLVVLIGMGYLIYRNWKKHPAISFGLLYFLITISLVTNVFTLIGATMGDRLLFAPVLGICIVVVVGLYLLLKQTEAKTSRTSAFYGVVFIAFLGCLFSFQRNKDWASNETLFAADVANAPNSARVHFNYGALLMAQLPEDINRQQSQLPEIVTAFERALAIDSLDKGSHINLGVCYYRLADYPKSIEHSQKAIEINPADITIVANLADAFFKANQLDSAVARYQKVIATKHATAGNFSFMGTALFNLKQYEKAIPVFQKGLKRFPKNEELLLNLGNSYGASGQLEKAKETFLEILAINPNNKQVMQFLALTYQQLGDVQNAQKYAAMAAAP